MIRALPDPRLKATVVARTPLRYTEGPLAAQERPPHVRAGSGLAWQGSKLVVVQDDAQFLAIVDPRTGHATAKLLPQIEGHRVFDEQHGNKKAKADLEAICAFPSGELVAFGSGSTPRRERVLLGDGLADASPFYAALRANRDFAGCQLNVEGAAILGDDLVLLNRGNGAPQHLARNATCRVAAGPFLEWLRHKVYLPPIRDVTPYDLGSIDGVKLTFTDAAPSGGALAYLAAAEASPDAVEDGVVAGTAFGWLEGGQARYTILHERAGRPFREKAEGLALDPTSPRVAWIVLDKDDPDAPSELCKVELG